MYTLCYTSLKVTLKESRKLGNVMLAVCRPGWRYTITNLPVSFQLHRFGHSLLGQCEIYRQHTMGMCKHRIQILGIGYNKKEVPVLT